MVKKALVLLLGGNVGDRLLYLKKALDLLSDQWGAPRQISSIYETAAWGFESADFYNLAVVFNSDLTAKECLLITQKIEIELGRTSKSTDGNYRARVMDIDILFYGLDIVDTEFLIIPHARIEERRFVLEPLKEIIPNFKHPRSGKSIEELWQQCPDISRIKKLNEYL